MRESALVSLAHELETNRRGISPLVHVVGSRGKQTHYVACRCDRCASAHCAREDAGADEAGRINYALSPMDSRRTRTNGPVSDLVGLKVSAAGKPIEWRRDPENMFAFHLQVPAGADRVDVALDFLLATDSSVTAELLDLSWNVVLLYPKGSKASELKYAATLRLPENWKYSSALPVASRGSAEIAFAPVSLETLVDSPVIAGAHFRSVDLSPGS